MPSKVLVIGSGLTALSFSYGSREEFDFIDPQLRFSEKFSESNSLNIKSKFGSEHMFVSLEDFLDEGKVDSEDNLVPASYGYGGFSTVWGNGLNVLPLAEINNWPVDHSQFEASYKDLLGRIPHVANKSELDIRFSWPTTRAIHSFHITREFKQLLVSLNNTSRSFHVGESRLSLNIPKCKKCSLCLSGCPYGALLDAGDEFDKLRIESKINLIQGKVTSLVPHKDGIVVNYLTEDGHAKTLFYNEVVIAAGPLSTAKILIESNLIQDKILIRDSQMFYGAVLSLRHFSNPQVNLSQITLAAHRGSNIDFSMSIYAPSSESKKRIEKFLKMITGFSIKLPRFINAHILPVIGFIDSESSGYIEIAKENGKLTLKNVVNPETLCAVEKSIAQVKKPFLKHGFFTSRKLFRLSGVGQGFHIGGSLPIDSKYIDSNGRLRNEPRIRIVDASVLPRIPAGSHSLTAMAMSHYLAGKKLE